MYAANPVLNCFAIDTFSCSIVLNIRKPAIGEIASLMIRVWFVMKKNLFDHINARVVELVLDGALDIAIGVHIPEVFALQVEYLCASDCVCFRCKLGKGRGACFACVDLGVGEVERAGGVPVFGVLASFAENLCFVHGIAEFKT